MKNPFGMLNTEQNAAIIIVSIVAAIVILSMTIVFVDNRLVYQAKLEAYNKCIQNNLDLQKENKSSFPVANYCKL